MKKKSDDVTANIPDAGKAYLTSKLHCNGCSKMEIVKGEFVNFVILFWDGFDASTGEPVVKDGVFDENGRVAIMKACPDCGPKIKTLHKLYSADRARVSGAILSLNDGPLKKMLSEIRPRIKSSWKFEIGWQIMLPILQALKAQKIAKSRMS